jgi:hypothetical protein
MARHRSRFRSVPALALIALWWSPGAAEPQEAVPLETAVPDQDTAPPREARPLVTRRLERQVGEQRLEATIEASGWVDERALDYLVEALRIVKVAQPDRRELWAFRSADATVDPRADEITIVLKALDGGDAGAYAWLPPDGFELVRPAVLRPRRELTEGLAKAREFRFAPAPREAAPAMVPEEARPFTRITGTVVCSAWNGSTRIRNPLSFVMVRVDGAEAQSGAGGAFDLSGSFHGGAQDVSVLFRGTVGSSPSSTLEVMDDLHASRSENRTVNPTATSGDVIDLGEVALSSADCELWRLGTIVLEDYHQAVGKSPPAKKLQLKRWSGVWDGTPYTYYSYVVLTTSFPEKGAYKTESVRRTTLFHEFGHSIRHVADGDEAHWGWDNFRWAYARSHTGCEVANTQYAFNEGWANYWEDGRVSTRTLCSPVRAAGFLDWNEDLIGKRLLELSNGLCRPGTPGECRRRMVEVLEKNPGAIHSLWEFEKKYCALNSGSRLCRPEGTPLRAAPASCPPGFHDDGATCRLENIKAKPSYGRGAGVVPRVCKSGQELDAGLCYETCKDGYDGVGPVCWQECPSGFRDDGAFCAKPQPYGRGAGYPWELGDTAFDLTEARQRCEHAHGKGKCEQDGLIFYPKCKSGFHNVGCCVCSPNCTGGMADIGVSCTKKSYGRGAGSVPTSCQGGMEYDAGLCYTPCRRGFDGVGPVCWGSCPSGFDDHGATCYRTPNVIVKY